MKRSWLEIARMAIGLSKAIHEKTQVVCPNPNCPLKLNVVISDTPLNAKVKITKESVDAQVKHHKEMYKRNHPNG